MREIQNGVGWKEHHQKLEQAELVRTTHRPEVGLPRYIIPGAPVHEENGTPRSWAAGSQHSHTWKPSLRGWSGERSPIWSRYTPLSRPPRQIPMSRSSSGGPKKGDGKVLEFRWGKDLKKVFSRPQKLAIQGRPHSFKRVKDKTKLRSYQFCTVYLESQHGI